ncbi:MAG: hypothetical protein KGL39_41860 [Patescibacteria group bacterium]|nr:hypothetical protein [Patescibacteria group bacterium]
MMLKNRQAEAGDWIADEKKRRVGRLKRVFDSTLIIRWDGEAEEAHVHVVGDDEVRGDLGHLHRAGDLSAHATKLAAQQAVGINMPIYRLHMGMRIDREGLAAREALADLLHTRRTCGEGVGFVSDESGQQYDIEDLCMVAECYLPGDPRRGRLDEDIEWGREMRRERELRQKEIEA